jgi:hypothetical protein
MGEFRISKYDPALRNSDGSFVGETWTSISDIGRVFQGELFTEEEYLATEEAYVAAIRSTMRACGIEELRVKDLEVLQEGSDSVPRSGNQVAPALVPVEGVTLSSQEVDAVVRLVLRECVWCRLVGDAGFFVHFGYDFYVYIGTGSADIRPPVSHTLFVEEFPSPYHPEDA